MRNGFSLPELAIVIAITGLLLLVGLPRLGVWLDRVAVARAAGEVTMTIALARNLAVAFSTRARVVIRQDSLLVDTMGVDGWARWRMWEGPGGHGVKLAVSNPTIVFTGNGLAWGLSNTRVVLTRGSHSETITVSRVGRVKRW
jgi:prepilin-type N-terminal cleavage/methylation domain-containing protein